MWKTILLCSFLCVSGLFMTVTIAETVNSTPCNSTGSERKEFSEVHQVNITPCAQAPDGPCEVSTAEGQTATISVEFTPRIKIGRRARQGIYWARKVDIQLQGQPKQACRNVDCTLKANATQIYRTNIPMKSTFPPSTYPVKVKIYEGSKTIFCRIVKVKLV